MTGVLWVVWLPMSWPQHNTAPSIVSAHLWSIAGMLPIRLVVSAMTPLDRPLTGTALSAWFVTPFTSARWPQHSTAPAVVNPQVWVLPTETEATPLDSPITAAGA